MLGTGCHGNVVHWKCRWRWHKGFAGHWDSSFKAPCLSADHQDNDWARKNQWMQWWAATCLSGGWNWSRVSASIWFGDWEHAMPPWSGCVELDNRLVNRCQVHDDMQDHATILPALWQRDCVCFGTFAWRSDRKDSWRTSSRWSGSWGQRRGSLTRS